jgi:hypothetical protein
MQDLTSIVIEMERQGKRLNGLLQANVLNSLTQEKFSEVVARVPADGHSDGFRVAAFSLPDSGFGQ